MATLRRLSDDHVEALTLFNEWGDELGSHEFATIDAKSLWRAAHDLNMHLYQVELFEADGKTGSPHAKNCWLTFLNKLLLIKAMRLPLRYCFENECFTFREDDPRIAEKII